MSKKIANNIVKVRGNVINALTGKGQESVCINLEIEEDGKILEFKTKQHGFFYFELDNTHNCRLTFKYDGYYDRCYRIPKGMSTVYFTCLIKLDSLYDLKLEK